MPLKVGWLNAQRRSPESTRIGSHSLSPPGPVSETVVSDEVSRATAVTSSPTKTLRSAVRPASASRSISCIRGGKLGQVGSAVQGVGGSWLRSNESGEAAVATKTQRPRATCSSTTAGSPLIKLSAVFAPSTGDSRTYFQTGVVSNPDFG